MIANRIAITAVQIEINVISQVEGRIGISRRSIIQHQRIVSSKGVHQTNTQIAGIALIAIGAFHFERHRRLIVIAQHRARPNLLIKTHVATVQMHATIRLITIQLIGSPIQGETAVSRTVAHATHCGSNVSTRRKIIAGSIKTQHNVLSFKQQGLDGSAQRQQRHLRTIPIS